MRLKDTIILVTVSTHGIGLAIVKSCVREGSSVCVAVLDLVQAKAIAAEPNAEGCRIHCIYNDAAKPEPFVPMVDENVQQSGRIAKLVNNFSTSARRTAPALSHTDPEVFLSTEMPNLHSVFMASQTAAKSMTARGKGSIINISSVGDTVPDISQIAYGTSKAAINDLTKLIAVQQAWRPMRCNAVLPGITATEAVIPHLGDNFRALFLSHIPPVRSSACPAASGWQRRCTENSPDPHSVNTQSNADTRQKKLPEAAPMP